MGTSPPSPAPSLRPVAASFTALGSFFGCWAVVAADVEGALGAGHGAFGLLLAVGLAGTATTSTIAGAWVERWGTRTVLVAGQVAFAAAVVAIGIAAGASPVALGAAIVALFACSGVVDVTMNVAAAAELAREPGRLVRFHAFFNAGAAGGAALTALVADGSGQWRWALGIPAVTTLAAAAWCRGATLPAGARGEHHGLLHAARTVKAEGMAMVAVVFACSAVVEGGIDTWGVLVLREQLGTTLLVGALAYSIGQVVATVSRATLGPAAGSLGTARGVAVGAGLAATGLTLLAVAPAGWAAAGLVLATAGISVCWPMLLAHASGHVARPAGVVGGITATGYVGFVVGPAVVGLLAEAVGLRGALLFLAAMAVLVAVAPSRVAARPRVVSGGGPP